MGVRSNLKRAGCGRCKAKPAGNTTLKGLPQKKFLREEEILAFKAQRNIYVALRKMRKDRRGKGFNTADVVICPL